MSNTRPAIRLDFTTGLDKLPPRPKVDASTTLASVVAGRELGFTGREVKQSEPKFDGRSIRSRGANTQLNLKVTAAEKEAILRDAAVLIRDPHSGISNIGEFVVRAVEFYRSHHLKPD